MKTKRSIVNQGKAVETKRGGENIFLPFEKGKFLTKQKKKKRGDLSLQTKKNIGADVAKAREGKKKGEKTFESIKKVCVKEIPYEPGGGESTTKYLP